MEPYGGDCLETFFFCLWILLLNKELRTQYREVHDTLHYNIYEYLHIALEHRGVRDILHKKVGGILRNGIRR